MRRVRRLSLGRDIREWNLFQGSVKEERGHQINEMSLGSTSDLAARLRECRMHRNGGDRRYSKDDQ